MSAPSDRAVRRVLHVITGLGPGGAERALVELTAGLDRVRWGSHVVALGPGGLFEDRLRDRGVSVDVLGMRSPWDAAIGLRRLRAIVRAARPDLVHGWMYHGNLAASLAGRTTGVPVVWSVRQSLSAPESDRPITELLVRVGARASGRVDAIVYNSLRAAAEHEAIGYDPRLRVIIRNGFDVDRFRPDPDARERVRAELGIPTDAPTSVCVARVHPVKDHATLLRAFRAVRQARPGSRLLLLGDGTDELELERGVDGLGQRGDVEHVLAAADVAVLASRAEAFPNAVGEAMACGVPCLATEVGDVADLIGACGWTVPPGEPATLARAWIEALELCAGRRQELGAKGRERIARRFSLDNVAAEYDRLYSAAVGTSPRPPR